MEMEAPFDGLLVLVINLLMPYVDVYTEAVVISMYIKQIN